MAPLKARAHWGRFIRTSLGQWDPVYYNATITTVLIFPLLSIDRNVALQGRATQSSIHRNSETNNGYLGMAINAIDGNRDSNLLHGSCSHTNRQLSPWWRVDLLRSYRIGHITITNRGDSFGYRLVGALILVGDSLVNNGNNNPRCAVVTSIPEGGTQTFQCNDMVGRYVNVILPGKEEFLHMCEVEVYTKD
ncbi:fucolectin-like [Leptodactylus fuscus]|uniref:fucolectin-like n=1 Tax=Leptodactylus fuscus TaxID=238119 RepID=UPI003F4E58C3